MSLIKKLNQTLGLPLLKVIGSKKALKYWRGLFINLERIFRNKSLYPVDHYMSDGSVYTIHHVFGDFKINPLRIDQLLKEGSYCFSSVRELYVKNCYLKFHHFDPHEIKTVVDLGANRGMASVMFVPVADRIIAIEGQPQYVPSIEYLVKTLNKFDRLDIGSFFIGSKNQTLPDGSKFMTMQSIMELYSIQHIDFLKIDIEGAEFEIFDHLPFDKIKYISMEVHPECGSVESLIRTLVNHHFEVRLADHNMVLTADAEKTDYIFANRRTD